MEPPAKLTRLAGPQTASGGGGGDAVVRPSPPVPPAAATAAASPAAAATAAAAAPHRGGGSQSPSPADSEEDSNNASHLHLPRGVSAIGTPGPDKPLRYGVRLRFSRIQVRVGSRFCSADGANKVAQAFRDTVSFNASTGEATLLEPKLARYAHVFVECYTKYKNTRERVSISAIIQGWLKTWIIRNLQKRKRKILEVNKQQQATLANATDLAAFQIASTAASGGGYVSPAVPHGLGYHQGFAAPPGYYANQFARMMAPQQCHEHASMPAALAQGGYASVGSMGNYDVAAMLLGPQHAQPQMQFAQGMGQQLPQHQQQQQQQQQQQLFQQQQPTHQQWPVQRWAYGQQPQFQQQSSYQQQQHQQFQQPYQQQQQPLASQPFGVQHMLVQQAQANLWQLQHGGLRGGQAAAPAAPAPPFQSSPGGQVPGPAAVQYQPVHHQTQPATQPQQQQQQQPTQPQQQQPPAHPQPAPAASEQRLQQQRAQQQQAQQLLLQASRIGSTSTQTQPQAQAQQPVCVPQPAWRASVPGSSVPVWQRPPPQQRHHQQLQHQPASTVPAAGGAAPTPNNSSLAPQGRQLAEAQQPPPSQPGFHVAPNDRAGASQPQQRGVGSPPLQPKPRPGEQHEQQQQQQDQDEESPPAESR